MGQFDLVPPEVAQGMIAAAKASPDNSVPVDEGFVARDADGRRISRRSERSDPPPDSSATGPFHQQGRYETLQQADPTRTVLFCKSDASLPPGAFLEWRKASEVRPYRDRGGSRDFVYELRSRAGALTK